MQPTQCHQAAAFLHSALLIWLSTCLVPGLNGETFTANASLQVANRTIVVSTGSSAARVAALLSLKPRNSTPKMQTTLRPTGTGSNEPKNAEQMSKLLQVAASSNLPKSVRVDSQSGRLLARVQTKRQTGATGSRRNEDPWFLDQPPYLLQPYRFAYNVKGRNGQTEQYRQEAGDGKFLTGSYGYVLPDGIYRHVDYVADDRGFRAFIRTSEPGTASQNPANVVIDANPSVVPGVSYASPTSGQLYQKSADLRATSYGGPSSTSQLYAPLDWSRSSDGLALPLRPPGDIINTPLRNFTSFSFAPTPSPALDLSPALTPASWNPLLRTDPTGQFLPTHRNLSSTQQINPSIERRGDTPLNFDSDHFRPLQQREDLRSLSQPSSLLSSNMPQMRPLGHLTNSLAYELAPPSLPGASRPALNSFVLRTGPTVLSYDRPFAGASGVGSSGRLSYDNNHVLHPDSPYLSLERARSLAQIENINLASRGFGYIRPLQPSELSSLHPASQAPSSTSGSFSSGHSEQHQHEERHSSRQLVDPVNKITFSQEHRSVSSSGSGREFGSMAGRPLVELQPPPTPQFQHSKGRQLEVFESAGLKGGRLQAPYSGLSQYPQQEQVAELPVVGIEQQSQGGHTKGGPTSTLATLGSIDLDERPRRLLSTPLPPPPPPPPSLPSPPSPPPPPPASAAPDRLKEPHRPDDDRKGSSGRAIPGELDHSRQPLESTKAHEEQEQQSSKLAAKGQQIRPVRMPEDYRSSLMSDWRSMQNALGLPQPPRLQRSSTVGHQEEGPAASGLNLAEHIVSSRINRVEALLGHSNEQQPTSGSVQQAVAVSAAGREQEAPKAAVRQQQVVTEPGGDQATRRLSTGRVQLEPNLLEGQLTGNSSDLFDAQRIQRNQRLQAEKVSELEKFQQRLRAQQLLLGQIKSDKSSQPIAPANKPNGTAITASQRPRVGSPSSGSPNSHVKYDEPNEIETSDRPSNGQQQQRDFNRLRRQNELPNVELNNKTNSSSESSPLEGHLLSKTPVVSELARQIQRWPSIVLEQSGGQRNASGSGQERNTVETSSAVGKKLNSVDAKPLVEASDSWRPSERPTDGALAGQQRKQPANTINLDFINSVTALSVDHLNPFAIASVNPAVQRSTGVVPAELPFANRATPSSGPSNGFATSPARYFNSAELLAALDGHERRDTSGQLRALLVDSTAGAQWPPGNHQAGPPYAMPNRQDAAASTTGGRHSLGAKFVVSPAGGSMAEAANSQHRSFAAPSGAQTQRMRQGTSQVLGSVSAASSSRALLRDGFEVRDRKVEVGDERFYEVVSNSVGRPSESYAAFRGELRA